MPHVIVKFYPERDPEGTRDMGQAVARALHETMGFRVQDVSVAIQVAQKETWMESVYEPDIAAESVRLVKRPGDGRVAERRHDPFAPANSSGASTAPGHDA